MMLWLFLAVVSAVLVRVMISVGALDHPVARSSHAVPTPKGGGVGIAAAYAVGTAWLLYRYKVPASALTPLGAALLLAAVSYVDDVRAGPFVVKLAAQVAATLAVIVAGDQINKVYISGQLINLPALLGPPLTFAVFLFVTNAVNFADGLNGLAGGSVGVAGLALAAGAAPGLAGAAPGAALGEQAMPLVAGIAGFLPFNFPRARIFMGDVGSQFCGFMLAVLAVVASRFQGLELSFLLVPMLLSGVLFDVAFTLLRRAVAGERLTAPHRGHLYQVAQRSGVPASVVALVHWGFAIYGGLCCLLFIASPTAWKPLVPALTLVPQLAWLGFVVSRAGRAGIERWG